MCIAIFSPVGSNCPSFEALHSSFENNPDGAGYAFNDQGQVVIKKGFMDWQSFWDSFSKDDKIYNFKGRGLLIHARIKTHGQKCPELCHPFPIFSDDGHLRKTYLVTDYAIIHNGVISLTSSKAYQEPNSSDTLVFVRDYLSLIAQNKAWMKRRCNIELIEKMIGSKMAILNGRGEIIHTSGFTEDGGIWYSNSSYKTPRVKTVPATVTNNYIYNRNYDDDYETDRVKSYNGGFWVNGAYNAQDSEGYNADDAEGEVSLMRCNVGDNIEGDSLSDVCTSYSERNYAIDVFGNLFVVSGTETYSTHPAGLQFEFMGSGIFIDRNGKEREFKPNIYVKESQFIGGYDDCLDSMYSQMDAPIDLDSFDD